MAIDTGHSAEVTAAGTLRRAPITVVSGSLMVTSGDFQKPLSDAIALK